MGDWVLRAIDQRMNLGPEFFGYTEVARRPQADRRPARLQQPFFDLGPDPFGGKIGKVNRSTYGDRRRINRVFEARGELHRAQNPQAVLDESVLIDDADDAARYVFPPTVRIEDFVRERVVNHRVDCEIAAARGLLETRHRSATGDAVE